MGGFYENIFNISLIRKHVDSTPVDSVEFIFDYDEDYERLLQVLHVVVKRVDLYDEKDQFPLLALEMRFMAYRCALSRDSLSSMRGTCLRLPLLKELIIDCPGLITFNEI